MNDFSQDSKLSLWLGRLGRHPRLRVTAGALLTLALLTTVFSPTARDIANLPDTLTLYPGQSVQLPVGVAALSSTDETLSCGKDTMNAESVGSGEMTVSLFGLFPLQKMQVEVTEKRTLIPGGQAVGVAMRTKGVLVVGVSRDSGADSALKAGDVILSVNGKPLAGAEELSALVEKSGGGALTISFTRDDLAHSVTLSPRLDESSGQYKLGVWVRDSTAGVGTLTYYDPENGTYGALGHAVNDSDTGKLLTISEGSLMRAAIVDVRRGVRGTPGEMRGSFLRDQKELGNIVENTRCGVYGEADAAIENPLYPGGLPVGSRGSVHTGKATILSTIDGSGVRAYEVEITQVTRQRSSAQKSFVIHVTDETLLQKTGGIVQGMSGSPVIQDGLLIGAVTHVFVDDPEQGYGVYIEWMLEQSDALEDKAA